MFFVDANEPPIIKTLDEVFKNDYYGCFTWNPKLVDIHYKNGRGYIHFDITHFFPCSKHRLDLLMDMLRTSDTEEAKHNCKIINDHLLARLVLDHVDQTAYGFGGKRGYKQLQTAYTEIRAFEKELME